MATRSRSRSRKPVHPDYPTGCTLAYLRVSTDAQVESGAGLQAQRTAIEAYAHRAGIQIDVWFTEEAMSGKVAQLQRPVLSKALSVLADCSAGALIVGKTDRVARNTADLLALRELAEAEGWSLSAADGSVDWSTAHGRAMSTVMGAFVELERDLIISRTREALAARKAAGQRLGRPATLPAEVRDRVAAERAAGATFAAVADGLNADQIATARGGARWYPSTVKAVMASLELDAYAAQRQGSE